MAIVYTKTDQGLTVATGTGAPTHTAIAGDRYTDTANGNTYQYTTLWNLISLVGSTATTGSVISFATPQVYNTPASPSASDLTDDLTSAKIGYIQKIYHNKAVAPTVPAGWVLIGTGTYTTSTLNIIFAEWVSGTRIEYWVTKPA
jgi:hypothetical protein